MSEKIEIYYVLSSLSRKAGGLFESVRGLRYGVEAAGNCTVGVFGVNDEHTLEDITKWGDSKPAVFPSLGLPLFAYSPKLIKAVACGDQDLVHTHGIWTSHPLATLAWHKKTRGPYLVSPRGMLENWVLRRSVVKKQVANFLYGREHLNMAACIHALCDAEAASIRKYGLKNPIATIPNAVTLPNLSVDVTIPESPQFQALHKQGLSILLFLSRITKKKGLQNLLQAWHKLGDDNKNWVLAIAGWDEHGHEWELRRLVHELGLPLSDYSSTITDSSPVSMNGGVVFLGPQFGQSKNACFAHADAFVLPSFSEGMPMAVLEAWAFGKPVLITEQCNLPEGYNCGAALRIELDTKQLASSLLDLFAMSQHDRQCMGLRGRKLVEENFSWDVVGKRMYETYRWILGGGVKPGFASYPTQDCGRSQNRIFFLSQFPPPYHGLSNATQTLFSSAISQKYAFQKCNMMRWSSTPKVIFATIFARSDLFYLTNSQTVVGNLRDLILVAIVALRRKKIVVHLHGGYYKRLYTDRFGPLQKWGNRLLFRSVDKAVVLGHSLRNMFEDVLPAEKVVVVHNCVASDSLIDNMAFANKVEALKAKSNLTVLYLSNFILEKGWFEVLKVASLCKGGPSKVHFLFVGQFYSRKDNYLFFDFVKENRLEKCVEYRGVVFGESKTAILRESDVFILPTRYSREGQPLSIIEAMGNGLAVICTPHSGIPDLVTDGVNGFFLEQQDTAGMKSALDKLFGDRELLARMAVSNRNRVFREFTQERYILGIENVFDQVIG